MMAQSMSSTNDKKAIAERCLIDDVSDAMPSKENPAVRINNSGASIVIAVEYSFIYKTFG